MIAMASNISFGDQHSNFTNWRAVNDCSGWMIASATRTYTRRDASHKSHRQQVSPQCCHTDQICSYKMTAFSYMDEILEFSSYTIVFRNLLWLVNYIIERKFQAYNFSNFMKRKEFSWKWKQWKWPLLALGGPQTTARSSLRQNHPLSLSISFCPPEFHGFHTPVECSDSICARSWFLSYRLFSIH